MHEVEHARRRAGFDGGSRPALRRSPASVLAGLSTTVLPNASAGAVFHAGIAIGKFHGVIRPNDADAPRDRSATSTPGRVEFERLAVAAQRFAGEVLEDARRRA